MENATRVPWTDVYKLALKKIYIYIYKGEVVSYSVLIFLFTTDEREQMCTFYKERGLEVPKAGKVFSQCEFRVP